MPPSVKENVPLKEPLQENLNYINSTKEEMRPSADENFVQEKPKWEKIQEMSPRQRKQKHSSKKLQELQNTFSYLEDYRKPAQPIAVHSIKHKERDMVSEMSVLYEFLTKVKLQMYILQFSNFRFGHVLKNVGYQREIIPLT